MEVYNQKLDELRKLKHELTMASRSLIDQQLEEPPEAPLDSVETQLDSMRSAMATAGSVTQVHELSDEDDEMVLGEEQDMEIIKGSRAAKANFKAATSPQKVANLHLKQKKEKAEK